MAAYVEIESLETLIKAIRVYQDELRTNRQMLANAANVCDVAMGSDYHAKKYIEMLNIALGDLEKTSQVAENVSESLLEEKRKVMEFYED